MIPAFKIGDRVWLGTYSLHEVLVTCPICFGKLAVVLTLGNGNEVQIECDYCGKGYDSPRGYVIDRQPSAAARSYVIDRVSVSSTDVEYKSEFQTLRAAEVFATEAEALAGAAEIAAKEKIAREARADYCKAYSAKSYAWNAGYHLSEAKRNRRSAEHHERMASICKISRRTEGAES